jgi:3-hydroxyacyl-CoA dehydrogenase / enoyl-CoA hydratase / 3-hydroxybutyryl-CoA epimerase
VTNKHLHLEQDTDGILTVTFDSPNASMNVISAEVVDEFLALAGLLNSDPTIKGAVITSGKAAFCAGADLKSLFDGMTEKLATLEGEAKLKEIFGQTYKLNAAFRALETCGKPVAAAISGLALGGGLEIALACHYRVLINDSKAKVGLPEVLIGLFPGAGGTQRLPRLVTAMEALPMMAQGKQIRPDKALQIGLVHALADTREDLIAKAKAWVKANPEAKAPWDSQGYKLPDRGVYTPQGMQIFGGASPMMRRETKGNYPAIRYLLSAVYEGLQVPIDAGLRIESRYFAKLLLRPESHNMIRSIFNSKQELEKGGRRPAAQTKRDVQTIAVIGAGFMGAGIANVSAQAGIKVFLIDVDQEGAERGKGHVVKQFDKDMVRGRATPERAAEVLGRIHPTTDYSVLKEVDLVVEAVFENSDLKNSITKAAEEFLPDDAVFGTNTSTIPITGLATASARPANYIGIHFFSPVEKMLLVEIIQGGRTGDYAISRAIDFVTKIKKTPILVQDTRGFYCNRCVLRFVDQGTTMLREGVNPALIENAARLAGMPMGPLELTDMTAIDLGYKILTQSKRDLGTDYVESPGDYVVEAMYELGRYGRKTQKGFYEYPEGGKPKLWPGLEDMAKGGLLPDHRQPSLEEVKDRILFAQALEAARCMEEGVVTDPREADVGSILAWGFAPYTGGVLSFIDTMGARAFVARAQELAKAHPGVVFAVPSLLHEMAAKGETFYGRFGASVKEVA